MKFLLGIIAFGMSIILMAGFSYAQNADETSATTTNTPNTREAAESRIDAEMVLMSDLSEALIKTIGQLHYLRTLCFGEDEQMWRDYAGKLLEIEAGDDISKKDYLTAAFNKGYYLEKKRYSNCTFDVSVDAAALAENGRHLASMLGDPYRDF